MRVTVKLFAILRERAGVAGLELDLPPGATAADAAAALFARHPALRDLASRAAYAVNCSYGRPSTPLHDGDELALIPPVSGG